MASPAAILSVLVNANTEQATAKLTKYDKQLAAINETSRKGIETKLTGNFNPVAFKEYEKTLTRTARIAKDRAAFKAELGANFNNRAFNQYEKAVDKTNKSTESTVSHNEKASHSFRTLATAVFAAGGAFIAFEKAKQAVETTVELGHATERLTAVTGLDAKQASAWIETMKVRNVQTKQVALSFITLSRNIRNAQDGSKTAKTAFDQLGISTDQLATQSTQETLLQVADGLSKVQQPAERAALAQQLFGRAAQGLIPVLVQGRKGVEDALGATEKYGAFLPKNVKNINQAIEAQRGLTLASDGLKIAFTTAVLPSLVKGAQAVLNFISQLRSGQGIGGTFGAIVGAAFQKVKDVVGVVVPIVSTLIAQFKAGDPAIRAMAIGVAGLVVALKAAATAQAALNVISEASPWVRAATLIAALVTALLVLQEKNKGVHDALENTWTSIRNFAQAVFPTIRDIAVRAFDIIVGTVHTLRDVFNAVFPVMRTIAVASFTIIKIQVQLLVAAFQVAFDIIKPIVVNAFKAIKFAVENVGIPAFHALSGPLHTLGSVFSTIWGGIKTVVKGAMDFILGAFAAFLHVVADVAGVKLPFLGKVFGNAAKSIDGAATSVDNLKRQLDGLPPKVSTAVDVKVNFLSNLPGAISSIGATISNVGAKVGGATAVAGIGHRAVGGMVDQPMIMVGEEAPKHPEVILATNPAYRQRNLGLFAQAGAMLGVPGFAQGGIATAGKMVSQLDPWTAQHADSWMSGKAKAWVKTKMPAAGGGGGGPSGAASGPVPAGSPRDWLTKALQITNHFSAANLAALYSRMIQESGGDPNIVNLWDSNAAAGHPSKGLLQTIDSTFNQYALPGLGGIFNPIANAVAAIRYMYARYGHIVGASSSGYAKGGILGKITGYKKGGITGFAKGGLTSAGSILGLPALPNVGGGGGSLGSPLWGLIAGARQTAGTISGDRTQISGLEQAYSSIDSYYSLSPIGSFVDPDTGLRDEKAIAARVAQLNVLIAYRQKIFSLWSFVVAYTQRLIASNMAIIARLQQALAGISTKGLKGKALATAQKQITDTKTAIAKYSGSNASARGDLTTAIGDRQSAWISLQGLLGEKFSVAGTVGQVASSIADNTGGGSLDNSPVTDDGTIQALQTLLTQANQRTAVSQAQYSVLSNLPFGGSFAQGGVVPGPLGAPSVIIAHGGEPVGMQTPQVSIHFASGMEWLGQFVDVRVSQAGRSTSRTSRRALPGSTGR